MPQFSKTQIDKLGERLREPDLMDEDLRMLDEYRRSFEPAYQHVVKTIREGLKIDPTGRPAKSTSSILDKLRRESTRGYRFSQIQDIAGRRIVIATLKSQDAIVQALASFFPGSKVDDIRSRPSNGYRAVHVIISFDSLRIEVQVRSRAQHFWAELCEKLADCIDPMVKYGKGPEPVKENLQAISEIVFKMDQLMMDANNDNVDSIKSSIDALFLQLESHHDILMAHLPQNE